ncbi:MAG: hypothetical protein WCV85_02800 [Patescibacteria group bacterium]|jgi:hypothetical protein
MPGKILIVTPPPGEAPDWVREAWVGLELPFEYASPGGYVGGVLTGKRVNRSGFQVNTKEALNILRQSNQKACAWWENNAPLVHMGAFVFDSSVCQVLD